MLRKGTQTSELIYIIIISFTKIDFFVEIIRKNIFIFLLFNRISQPPFLFEKYGRRPVGVHMRILLLH